MKPSQQESRETEPGESSARAIVSILGNPGLRPAALASTGSIFRNFFFLQYKAALFPRRFVISQADHPLDEGIPFVPGKVKIYLDFLHFFIRAQGFLIRNYKTRDTSGKVMAEIKDFITALGSLYARAAGVYGKNFSTTRRPRYLASFRFVVIHTFDPHLMCIPSLHVMVVIFTYIRLKKILCGLGDDREQSGKIEAVRRHALAITEAVLYVKQHSVNCVPAAMYAISSFDNAFTPEEAVSFTQDLFKNAEDISEIHKEAVRDHILNLYRRFLNEGQNAPSWEKPLLDFLGTLPKK